MDREARIKYQRERRQRLKESGLCQSCGKPRGKYYLCDVCYAKNREQRILHPEWYKNWREAHKQEQNLKHKAKYRERKLLVFNYYGSICICCNEANTTFLTVDHINNDGAAHRRGMKSTTGATDIYLWLIKNNFPADFQILCWNCNEGKRLNNGICPHIEGRD